jgi:hypothetical protein
MPLKQKVGRGLHTPGLYIRASLGRTYSQAFSLHGTCLYVHSGRDRFHIDAALDLARGDCAMHLITIAILTSGLSILSPHLNVHCGRDRFHIHAALNLPVEIARCTTSRLLFSPQAYLFLVRT